MMRRYLLSTIDEGTGTVYFRWDARGVSHGGKMGNSIVSRGEELCDAENIPRQITGVNPD
jgi:hypothetical protein